MTEPIDYFIRPFPSRCTADYWIADHEWGENGCATCYPERYTDSEAE